MNSISVAHIVGESSESFIAMVTGGGSSNSERYDARDSSSNSEGANADLHNQIEYGEMERRVVQDGERSQSEAEEGSETEADEGFECIGDEGDSTRRMQFGATTLQRQLAPRRCGDGNNAL